MKKLKGTTIKVPTGTIQFGESEPMEFTEGEIFIPYFKQEKRMLKKKKLSFGCTVKAIRKPKGPKMRLVSERKGLINKPKKTPLRYETIKFPWKATLSIIGIILYVIFVYVILRLFGK